MKIPKITSGLLYPASFSQAKNIYLEKYLTYVSDIDNFTLYEW